MSTTDITQTQISSVPALPVQGQSVAELLAALRVAVQDLNSLITNFNAGGVSETYLESISIALGNDASTVTSGALAGVYQAVNNVQNAAYILTASGAALDNIAANVGIYRKPAVAAVAPAAIVFTPNTPVGTVTTIPAGIILSAPNADPTQPPTLYQTTSSATVNVGATSSTPAAVQCLTAGTVGNCPAGTVNAIVAGLAGYSVTNVTAISGGLNTEGDDTPAGGLRMRALNAVASASQCTTFALQQDALKYPGISSAVVYDNTGPPPALTPTLGLVQIFCDDGTGTLGAQTLTTDSFEIPYPGQTFEFTVANANAFPNGSNVQIQGGPDIMTALIIGVTGASDSTADVPGTFTCQMTALAAGNVGDTVNAGAIVVSPNVGALSQFNADLDAGNWKAAGAFATAWGSTIQPIYLYMEIYTNEDYVTNEASIPEVEATVQQQLFNVVNALAIGRPVVLSTLIDAAKNVAGVSEVPLQTVLINGANADFGVTNGILSLNPASTCRIEILSNVTVVNRLTVPY